MTDTAPVRIVAILASPRGSGSTATAVAGLLDGAVNVGAESVVLDLSDTSIATAVAAIEDSDAVVFGSPTYRANHTSLLGMFLENVERGAAREKSAPLAGKACAVLLCGASDAHFLATQQLRGILTDFFAAQVLAPSLYLTPAAFGSDKHLTDETRELVMSHGAALSELALAVRSSTAMKALKPLV